MAIHKLILNNCICFVLILLLTTSCQNNTVYHSYQPVETTGWDKNDTLVYSLQQALTKPNYLYELGIRHKDSYKYRDIWLSINQDTLHLYLADSIGNWKGNGIGDIRHSVYSIQLTPSLQDSIKEFRITHIMQDNPINGILNIGFKIQEAN